MSLYKGKAGSKFLFNSFILSLFSCQSTPPSHTWDRPRCTDAVSEMYMILPSDATTKTKPSKV